jgi:hypothetical protein
MKDRQIREASAREGAFPEEVLAGDTTVTYAEVFPSRGSFEFQLDSDEWVADDMYCLDPECNCGEVFLSFIPPSEDDPTEDMPEEPTAFYDYGSASFDASNEPAGQPAPATLVGALRQAHPDLDLRLEQRHRELKSLYRDAVQNKSDAPSPDASSETPEDLKPPTPIRKSVRVGRNEPCPCGSGKKYKKCCGM